MPKRFTARAALFALAALLACASARPMARVALRCPEPKAELSVDGAPAGLVEDYRQRGLSLRPGRHVFSLRAPDGRAATREAELGPGDDVTLSIGFGGGDAAGR